MRLLKIFFLGVLIFSSWIVVSCNKDFLDKKPRSSLVVPSTLDDFRALLDDYSNMNGSGDLVEVSSDDYYILNNSIFQSIPLHRRNASIWLPDIYEGTGNISDWNALYKQIFYANIVLDGLSKLEVTEANKSEWNNIRGWALFVRSFAFYNLAQAFAPAFDESTAQTDMSIPLRLEPGVTNSSVRASVKATYDQILADLNEAIEILPEHPQTPNRNRPCKPAALTLVSRVYLSMRNYDKALEYADLSLQAYNILMDYNSYVTGRTNPEVLYQAEMGFGSSFFQSVLSNIPIIDSTLYASYSGNDLRKTQFFRLSANRPYPNQSYAGVLSRFTGLATDEVYLIKAECLARKDDAANAIKLLNDLLVKRYRVGTFVPLAAGSGAETVNTILAERRKELIFRGVRWMDLRRLNKEGRNISLKRSIGGIAYTLPPNSPLYVLPIPPDEVRLSGIPQNPR